MRFEVKQIRPQQEAVVEKPTMLQLVQRENGDIVLQASGGTSSDFFRQSVMTFRNGRFVRHGMFGRALSICTEGMALIAEDEPLSLAEQQRESDHKMLSDGHKMLLEALFIREDYEI